MLYVATVVLMAELSSVTESVGHAKAKIFTLWTFKKKVANSSLRGTIGLYPLRSSCLPRALFGDWGMGSLWLHIRELVFPPFLHP